jgi:hypothetical protein
MKIEFLVAYNNYKVGEIVDLGDDSSTVEAFSGNLIKNGWAKIVDPVGKPAEVKAEVEPAEVEPAEVEVKKETKSKKSNKKVNKK